MVEMLRVTFVVKSADDCMMAEYPRREYRGFINGCYVIQAPVKFEMVNGVMMWSMQPPKVVAGPPKLKSKDATNRPK